MERAALQAALAEIDTRLADLRAARVALWDLYCKRKAEAARSPGAEYYWLHRETLLRKKREKRRRLHEAGKV